MAESTYPSWISSLAFLRSNISVPAAMANATTLVAARNRWSQHLVCRTSMHDLLFTVPGDEYPFTSSVVVSVDGHRHTVRLSSGAGDSIFECDESEVDSSLDNALELLFAPNQVCRACGAISVDRNFASVFERMHYVCFHFEFEHGDTDRDQPCHVPGCPIA